MTKSVDIFNINQWDQLKYPRNEKTLSRYVFPLYKVMREHSKNTYRSKK